MAFFKKGKPKDENLPSLGDVFSNFSIQHNLQYLYTRLNSGKDTLYQSVHSINLNGSIPLTKNWKVNVGQIGYDILRKGFSYPDFGLERDLHCWTMKFQYYPSAKAFSFFIGVKPGSLEFIKIPNNQNLTGGGR
jgi:lipopolysaccharide assembly outer membrane protein LptD (OstA)